MIQDLWIEYVSWFKSVNCVNGLLDCTKIETNCGFNGYSCTVVGGDDAGMAFVDFSRTVYRVIAVSYTHLTLPTKA